MSARATEEKPNIASGKAQYVTKRFIIHLLPLFHRGLPW